MRDLDMRYQRVKCEINRHLRECSAEFSIEVPDGVDMSRVIGEILNSGGVNSSVVERITCTVSRSITKSIATIKPSYWLGKCLSQNIILSSESEAARICDMLIKQDMSDLLKAYVLHNYLARTVMYEDNKDNAVQRCYSHSPYGALISHKAVCQGIANAFQLLMDVACVKSWTVMGKAKSSQSSEWEPHAWNMIAIDGNHYAHVDVTFDLASTGADTKAYFARNDVGILGDHRWEFESYPKAEERVLWRKLLNEELKALKRQLLLQGVPEAYLVLPATW